MSCHRIVAGLAAPLIVALGAALITVNGCKGANHQSTRDAVPEIGPVGPQSPPSSPSPSSVDAAVDRFDAIPDRAVVDLAKAARKQSAPDKPSRTGRAGVSTMQVTGNLSRAVADEVLRGRAASFETCHAEGAQHGQVQVKLTMNERGVVEIAKVVKSTLSGGEAELCMARVAQRFKFPPSPGGESTVTFQLKF